MRRYNYIFELSICLRHVDLPNACLLESVKDTTQITNQKGHTVSHTGGHARAVASTDIIDGATKYYTCGQHMHFRPTTGVQPAYGKIDSPCPSADPDQHGVLLLDSPGKGHSEDCLWGVADI